MLSFEAVAGRLRIAPRQILSCSEPLLPEIRAAAENAWGGVGNLWGTLVAAFSLGIANKFLEPFAGAVLGKIAILVFIILFIQKRPRGLFALKGRAVEA